MIGFPTTFWSETAPGGGGGGGGTYVNSVQHISITIPTGAASATATISSVGSYAFILMNGFQTNAPSNTLYAYPRIELTDSTTVTAYRNSSSGSYSVIVKCCVIDATSSLVASVQMGTITIGASSSSTNTTISSVNSNYTAVHFLGCTSTQASLAYPSLEALLSLSGTTLTATRISSNTNSVTVGYLVLEFQSAACAQAIQGFQKTWTNSGTTTTESITSVDMDNSFIIHAGSVGNSSSNSSISRQHAALTNSTTVTLTTNSAGSISCYYNFFVVELAPGILNSNVSRGTTSISGASNGTSSISSVVKSKSLISSLQYISTQASANLPNTAINVELTDSTTVTASRHNTVSTASYSWEVVEFA